MMHLVVDSNSLSRTEHPIERAGADSAQTAGPWSPARQPRITGQEVDRLYI